MNTPILPTLLATSAAALLTLTACSTTRVPVTATTLEPKVLARIDHRVVEPGFTPEMVYLALGKPTFPAESLVDSATNGTWVYENLGPRDFDFLRAGFRRRVVFDPARQRDVVVTKRLDPAASELFAANSLVVTFREGRVIEIARTTEAGGAAATAADAAADL